jgi:hypothetical protein
MPDEIPAVVQNEAKGLHGFGYVVDPRNVTQPVLRPVLDYWEQKRTGRKLPRRIDIDPLELKPYLRHLCLIDVLAGVEFRYRLIGSEITERYGRNSTGRTVRQIYADMPVIAEWLTAMMVAATSTARPVFAWAPLAAIGKEYVLAESLHLPLGDDAGAVTTIFGVTRYSVPGRS